MDGSFIPPAERVDQPRLDEFEDRIRAAAEELGFGVVHFTLIARPQRVGFLPWISAHFEQLPRPAEER